MVMSLMCTVSLLETEGLLEIKVLFTLIFNEENMDSTV